jgi:hypothetical protein
VLLQVHVLALLLLCVSTAVHLLLLRLLLQQQLRATALIADFVSAHYAAAADITSVLQVVLRQRCAYTQLTIA